MKKSIAIAFAFMILLSVFTFGVFIVSAEEGYVVGQEMTFAFGDAERTGVYTGQIKDGLAHGQGRFEWINPDGDTFVHEGGFSNGAITGYGTRTFNGDEYIWEGEFSDGELPGGDSIPSLIRGGGMLGFALWLVIALIIFLTMMWVTAVVEMMKRFSRYNKARLFQGALKTDKSIWKMSGADFAALDDLNTSFVVGKKPVFTTIMGIVTIIIALDVWWAIGYGFNTTFFSILGFKLTSSYIFLILVISTIQHIVKAVIELNKSIRVEEGFVKINGADVPCGHITDVSVPKKDRIMVKTYDGKHYKLFIINAQAVSDAILANKARMHPDTT